MAGARILEVGLGEEHKTLATVERLYQGLLDAGADRKTLVVGFGGGIVCDLAGFAASTFLRGTRLAFVPTTLLAQVDASVGGKNGVNFQGYKNQVGVFRQPELVICDFALLRTLPEREVRCGLAEVVKAAAIADAELFAFLEANADRVLALDPGALERIVSGALQVKADIVGRDETESGERMKLNFGHTFGHAIEKTMGLPHGEAVAAGMVIACDLAAARGLLDRGAAKRIEALLEKLGLPTRVKLDKARVADALVKDKKRFGQTVNAVLLDGIGRARLEPIELRELQAVLP
jgi:3-dehydroquinate synthase